MFGKVNFEPCSCCLPLLFHSLWRIWLSNILEVDYVKTFSLCILHKIWSTMYKNKQQRDQQIAFWSLSQTIMWEGLPLPPEVEVAISYPVRSSKISAWPFISFCLLRERNYQTPSCCWVRSFTGAENLASSILVFLQAWNVEAIPMRSHSLRASLQCVLLLFQISY